MSIKRSSDQGVMVNTEWVLFPADMIEPPKGIPLLCGNINSGKTVISDWKPEYGFTHWGGLPVFPKSR